MIASLTLPSHAIGIIDSGVGGLSVLREIKRQLPQQTLVYFSDSAHAPYGEKPYAHVQMRTMTICNWLFQQGINTLVVACNTATAHSIHQLRAHYPDKLIIGIEPGLKPAQAQSTNGMIGVLATHNTLNSDKFRTLAHTLQKNNPHTRFICQAGTGLAALVEQGKADSIESETLLHSYLQPMLSQHIDTLVLGCTHYIFLFEIIRRIVGPQVHLIDTSYAVAHQLCDQLLKRSSTTSTCSDVMPATHLLASATPEHLSLMAKCLLDIELEAYAISI